MTDGAGSHLVSEPTPQWYSRTGRCFFGNMYVHWPFSILYVVLCITPLISALVWKEQVLTWTQGHPWPSFVWALVVALGYPSWAWLETIAFERWVRTLSESARKLERAHYQLHVGMAKNFWQAVMQMYTVASLIGIALKG